METIIIGALTGAIDPETAEKLMEIETGVTYQVHCPISGRVLNSQTALLWDLMDGKTLVGRGVFDPTVEREAIEAIVPPGLSLGSVFDPAPVYAQL